MNIFVRLLIAVGTAIIGLALVVMFANLITSPFESEDMALAVSIVIGILGGWVVGGIVLSVWELTE